MTSLALIFESKSRTKLRKLKAYNRSNLPKKSQRKNRTYRRRCLWAEGTFTLILVRETERRSLLSPCPRIASLFFCFFLRVFIASLFFCFFFRVFIFSLPSPHSVPSLFIVLPRFWVCKIVSWNFLISSPLILCFFLHVLFASLCFYLGVRLALTGYLLLFFYNEKLLNRLIFLFIMRGF